MTGWFNGGVKEALLMDHPYLLSEARMRRITPFFPLSNGRMSYYEKPGQNSANMAATDGLRELLTQIQNAQK